VEAQGVTAKEAKDLLATHQLEFGNEMQIRALERLRRFEEATCKLCEDTGTVECHRCKGEGEDDDEEVCQLCDGKGELSCIAGCKKK
jgi:RecJ-like exonuclease